MAADARSKDSGSKTGIFSAVCELKADTLAVIDRESQYEKFIYDYVCIPLQRLLPHSLHPNWITMTNAVLMIAMTVNARMAPRNSPADVANVCIVSGLSLLLSVILDSLDGTHARITK